MTKQELIKALDSGLDVRWSNDGYECFKDVTGIYSVICTSNDSMIGIFSKDMQRTNIGLKDCYIKEEQSKWKIQLK